MIGNTELGGIGKQLFSVFTRADPSLAHEIWDLPCAGADVPVFFTE